MAQPITILVGTMTGTAELVAEDMRDRLAEAGREARIVLMDGLTETVFEAGGVFLICSSTYGQGDVPDNAIAFYEQLQAARPDLSGIRYGVFAMGDRTYADTFCNGGRRFDALLSALGAVRVGEVMLHDASSGTLPEEVGAEWVCGWADGLDAVESAAA